MKHILHLCGLAILLTGCLSDECQDEITYQSYTPIIVSAADWRLDEFATAPASDICDPSGFYVYGNYLFVLDRNEGLHIIDNTDNANPRPVKFLQIPGGQGIAARNSILYVNQYVDLLAFDISDPADPEFLSRTKNVFELYSTFSTNLVHDGDVVVGYTEGTESVTVDCNSPFYNQGWYLEDDVLFAAERAQVNNFSTANGDFAAMQAGGTPETVGTGGSLARFTISKGTLYAVDDNSLRTFSLAKADQPEFVGTSQLGWGIETIFPYGDELYIGANNGMHIYSIDSPHDPQYLSTFQHVRSCDPVIVQNDIAYVTMWGGSNCGDQGDRLMVVDVEDPSDPQLLQEIPMVNSHGLGIDGDRLFLCSATDGIRVYSVTPEGLLNEEVHQATGFNAMDVIVRPVQNELIVFGWETNGIKQYDYSDDGILTAVSDLSVCD
ncbi:hypothetical protein GGR28_000888 [Lewinella aquimaris]|uniref:LVIVD repeat-containing protein n=1 Tax=Neolewinella aquimaris TaxID=1835722 RepID=A0A840E562_9BACT|nr:hypothetical protein [Neolewinella aquimaris]MBB4078287.1 hypothetical protein [Neolewinella aquimaris]